MAVEKLKECSLARLQTQCMPAAKAWPPVKAVHQAHRVPLAALVALVTLMGVSLSLVGHPHRLRHSLAPGGGRVAKAAKHRLPINVEGLDSAPSS